MDSRLAKTFWQKYQDAMPKGAGVLFLIQIFPMLGFSVLYSTLILYATKGLHMDDISATNITASFLALNFFLHLFGGYLSGRFLSNRSLFAIGMILEIIGCLMMAYPTKSALLWGLAIFLAGNGLNITCINCMLVQLFQPDDKRCEAAFLWNYSSMNIGFFIGYSVGGYFDLHQNYTMLFLLSGIGNVIAFILTIYNWQILKDRDTLLSKATIEIRTKARLLGLFIIFSLVFILRALLNQTSFCNNLVMIVSVVMVLFLLLIANKQPTQIIRNKIYAYLIFAVIIIFFWTLVLIAPMGLNLFIERNVDRHFFGMAITTQWLQNSYIFVSIIGAPFVSYFFVKLRERGFVISLSTQFSIALFLTGIAFSLLPIGIQAADAKGYTSISWLLASFFLQSIGDLFISPVSYAMAGQLAPLHLRGLMSGMWMMFSGFAAILAHYFSKLAIGEPATIDPLITNASYSEVFGFLGLSAIIAGALFYLSAPFIDYLTQERQSCKFNFFTRLSGVLAFIARTK